MIPAPSDVAAPPADATVTPSGLASRQLEAGTGTNRPGPRSRVLVHYSGWTTDGRMFDSSVSRGEPIAFGLNQVIAGWTEGGAAQGQLGLGIGGCALGAGPAADAVGSVLIRMDATGPFLPLIRAGRLADLLGSEGLAAIAPCQGAE